MKLHITGENQGGGLILRILFRFVEYYSFLLHFSNGCILNRLNLSISVRICMMYHVTSTAFDLAVFCQKFWGIFCCSSIIITLNE